MRTDWLRRIRAVADPASYGVSSVDVIDSRSVTDTVAVDRRYYTPREVAQILGVSQSTVLRLIHGGRLIGLRVSARIYRIPVSAFDAFQRGERWEPGDIEVRVAAADAALPIAEGERLPIAEGGRLPMAASQTPSGRPDLDQPA